MRGVTASNVSVTVAARFTCRVASTIAADFLHVAARFLDADDIGMPRQLDHHFRRHVVSRKRRNVVDQHRQWRTVRHRAIERQQIRRLHRLL